MTHSFFLAYCNTPKCVHRELADLNHSKSLCSDAQSCLTLCHPMNLSRPGLPVRHQLPESTQTHVHLVGGAIQPSHPLSSPSPPAPNLSQHQDTCIFMAESLHWSPETVKTLLIGYTPKQNVFGV